MIRLLREEKEFGKGNGDKGRVDTSQRLKLHSLS